MSGTSEGGASTVFLYHTMSLSVVLNLAPSSVRSSDTVPTNAPARVLPLASRCADPPLFAVVPSVAIVLVSAWKTSSPTPSQLLSHRRSSSTSWMQLLVKTVPRHGLSATDIGPGGDEARKMWSGTCRCPRHLMATTVLYP
jgi:hypothetical protein